MRFSTGIRLLFLIQYQTQAVKAFSVQRLSSQTIFAQNESKHRSSSSNHRYIQSFPRAGYSPSLSERNASISKDVEMSRLRSQNDRELPKVIKEAASSCLGIAGQSTYTDFFGNIPFVNTSVLTKNKEHRVVFILGGPGAGKGTQSEKIVDTYKCIHLSVGELLRKERKRENSEHSELIEECLVAGKIVPVEISLALVKSEMDRICKEGAEYGQPIFLVDGFPRNFDNLEGWTKVMPSAASALGALVYDCPIEVLEQRILNRAETSGRSDDNLESARKRFETFQSQTMPVVHALEEVENIQAKENIHSIGMLHVQHIEGDGTVEEVWGKTKRAMNDFVKNDVLTANSQLLEAISNKKFDIYRKLCSPRLLIENFEIGNENLSLSNEIQLRQSFEKYELDCQGEWQSCIVDSDVKVINGTRAVVTYTRNLTNSLGEIVATFQESRTWSHEVQGWSCVHFARKPLSIP